MVRLCVCVCVSVHHWVHSVNSAALTRCLRCLSPLPTHTLPRSAALPFFIHTHTSRDTPRTSFTSVCPASRRDRVLIWSQYLALASQAVWSPTSFSASAGRKWPNTRAPVLRRAHCCHIKAQICTVAQLKFPTLPLLCTPRPTPLEQMQSWITVCFDRHGVSTAAHWYQRRNLIGRLIRNQAIEEEKTIEAAAMSQASGFFSFDVIVNIDVIIDNHCLLATSEPMLSLSLSHLDLRG